MMVFQVTLNLNVLLVRLIKEIVGMLWIPRYSTWKGPTIHLEDLIVTKSKRDSEWV